MRLCMLHLPPIALAPGSTALRHSVPAFQGAAVSRRATTWRLPRRSGRTTCHSSKQLVNYYEVLEVSEDADAEQLRTAYRIRAKVLHPDVNPAPNAAKQFLQLKRAYDTLKDALLRNEHDSKLGLVSARAKDPRFARFERWRREVLPDLNLALDVWTAEVLRVIQEEESTLCRLQAAATAAAGGASGANAGAASSTPAAGAGNAATASKSAEAPSTPLSTATQQQQQGSGPTAIELYSDMDRVLREAQGNVERLYSKRYEQVCSMYLAYPDIVWYDVWEAVSEEWLLESKQLAGRWQQVVATGLQQHEAPQC
jgi:curved DNA-binding protein CbpA